MSNESGGTPPSKESEPQRTFFPPDATAKEIAAMLNKMVDAEKAKQK